MTGYQGWCFYCKRGFAGSAALQQHVLAEHPDSIRAQNYHAEQRRNAGEPCQSQ